MTRKRVVELTVMVVAVSVFGAFQYNLGMRHSPEATIVLDVTACEPEPDEVHAADLRPL